MVYRVRIALLVYAGTVKHVCMLMRVTGHTPTTAAPPIWATHEQISPHAPTRVMPLAPGPRAALVPNHARLRADVGVPPVREVVQRAADLPYLRMLRQGVVMAELPRHEGREHRGGRIPMWQYVTIPLPQHWGIHDRTRTV